MSNVSASKLRRNRNRIEKRHAGSIFPAMQFGRCLPEILAFSAALGA